MIPKKLLSLVFASGILLFSNGAHALSFQFDFIGFNQVTGAPLPGDFSGEIYGLQEGVSQAQSVKLTSINGFTYNYLFNNTDGYSTFNRNSFTVLNGQVTAADLSVSGWLNPPNNNPRGTVSVELNQISPLNGSSYNTAGEMTTYYGGNNTLVYGATKEYGSKEAAFAGVTYTAIPEPSTYALLGLGAIGLLMVLRKKKTVSRWI
jgi:hypothetical protein